MWLVQDKGDPSYNTLTENETVISVMLEGSQTNQQRDEDKEADTAYKPKFSELQECVDKMMTMMMMYKHYIYSIRNSHTHTINTLYLVNAQTATCFGLFLGHHQACITILK
jgi:hypothetical protein